MNLVKAYNKSKLARVATVILLIAVGFALLPGQFKEVSSVNFIELNTLASFYIYIATVIAALILLDGKNNKKALTLFFLVVSVERIVSANLFSLLQENLYIKIWAPSLAALAAYQFLKNFNAIKLVFLSKVASIGFLREWAIGLLLGYKCTAFRLKLECIAKRFVYLESLFSVVWFCYANALGVASNESIGGAMLEQNAFNPYLIYLLLSNALLALFVYSCAYEVVTEWKGEADKLKAG